MDSRDPHPIEAIHALVDGRLDAPEREAVERHLEECAACREELQVADATRGILRRSIAEPVVPQGLAERIGSALDDVDGETGAHGSEAAERAAPDRVPRRTWMWLAAAAAVIALVAFVVPWDRDPGVEPPGDRIVAAVAADFGRVKDGSLPLGLQDADPARLAAHFVQQGIEFETRVFDLAMMDYHLAGGRVQDLEGRSSALFAYRGPDGVMMVCRMYLGNLEELPAPSRTLEHDGITFHVYERDGRTLVFWEEGDVVCVLSSDAPAQAVIDLSFAKAVKV